jgi:molybdopterin converting factor small subunit
MAKNITVEFLSLPNIVRKIGSKSVVLNLSGTTVDDLVHEVAEKYGSDVRKFLLDEDGHLDMTLAVMLNRQEWIRHHQMDKTLQDGDHITILMLAAGG